MLISLNNLYQILFELLNISNQKFGYFKKNIIFILPNLKNMYEF